MKTVIKVENLSKLYRLGQVGTGTLSDDLNRWWHKIRGKEDPYLKIGEVNDRTEAAGASDYIWALRHVDFDIAQGEVLGIIGRNGSGKSTLLKILSKTTTPTTGSVKIIGRVASLLEVGTGFHPELSGRDNIYLNGAILGMRKKEIRRKFDEIVAFAGVERYIDTPVKRYSSGMYVRLAFAVAAHLESEILIVDEVLAVGDAEFQKKCLGKMGELSKGEGKTVLFVSHNMHAVKQLCTKGILFEHGQINMVGPMKKVMDRYENRMSTSKTFKPIEIPEIKIIVTRISMNEQSEGIVTPYQPLKIDIEFEAENELNDIGIELLISNDDTNGIIFRSNTKTSKNLDVHVKKGKNVVSCLIKNYNLCSGRYHLGFAMSLLQVKYYYYEEALLSFDVAEVLVEPSSLYTLPVYSHVYLDHHWIIQD